MARTRVPSEQLQFRSELTGSHLLDTYLEDAEYGSLTLAQLLGKIFNDSGDIDLINFQYDNTAENQRLFVRIGTDGPLTEIASFIDLFNQIEAKRQQAISDIEDDRERAETAANTAVSARNTAVSADESARAARDAAQRAAAEAEAGVGEALLNRITASLVYSDLFSGGTISQ